MKNNDIDYLSILYYLTMFYTISMRVSHGIHQTNSKNLKYMAVQIAIQMDGFWVLETYCLDQSLLFDRPQGGHNYIKIANYTDYIYDDIMRFRNFLANYKEIRVYDQCDFVSEEALDNYTENNQYWLVDERSNTYAVVVHKFKIYSD